jgi:enolase
MAKIQQVLAREILDSRGIPAIEVSIVLDDGNTGTASSATEFSATATGVSDLWDHDEKRFQGNGLLQAIETVEKVIQPKLLGIDNAQQSSVDKALLEIDGTPTKSKIGANTMISTSMAVAISAAKSQNISLFRHLMHLLGKAEGTAVKLPLPCFTMIDGGKNANFMIDMQEFVMIPASFKTFKDSLEMGIALHNLMKYMLLKENLMPFVGEKGGFAPLLSTNEDALSLIKQATEQQNFRLGYDLYLGIDVNASNFYRDNRYKIKDRSMSLPANELVTMYDDFAKKYHVLYLEDPMANEDVDGWSAIYKSLNQSVIIAGDYFTATNPFRLQMALAKGTINAMSIKPSQIGTVTETLAVAEMAKAAGLKLVVSDRSGETDTTFLADLAVAIGADYAKFGAPVRGERVAKYNRLMQIEREITPAV